MRVRGGLMVCWGGWMDGRWIDVGLMDECWIVYCTHRYIQVFSQKGNETILLYMFLRVVVWCRE